MPKAIYLSAIQNNIGWSNWQAHAEEVMEVGAGDIIDMDAVEVGVGVGVEEDEEDEEEDEKDEEDGEEEVKEGDMLWYNE
jgi:hypothetical protein